MLQTEIKCIVLAIKESERRVKRLKEILSEKLRTLQNDPSSALGSFAPYTQRFLYEIKTSEEENKWCRKNLHEILTRMKSLYAEAKESPIPTEQTSVPDIQTQHTIETQNNHVTPECKPGEKAEQIQILLLNTPASETNPNSLKIAVKFKIYLTTLEIFTGEQTENRMGIG